MNKTILTGLLIFMSTINYAQNWLFNYDNAMLQAQKENKNIVMILTGSDWCAPCIKLEKTF